MSPLRSMSLFWFWSSMQIALLLIPYSQTSLRQGCNTEYQQRGNLLVCGCGNCGQISRCQTERHNRVPNLFPVQEGAKKSSTKESNSTSETSGVLLDAPRSTALANHLYFSHTNVGLAHTLCCQYRSDSCVRKKLGCMPSKISPNRPAGTLLAVQGPLDGSDAGGLSALNAPSPRAMSPGFTAHALQTGSLHESTSAHHSPESCMRDNT